MSQIYFTEPVRESENGERSVTIHTSGALGSEADAIAAARELLGVSNPVLGMRVSDRGALTFVFTDRVITYA